MKVTQQHLRLCFCFAQRKSHVNSIVRRMLNPWENPRGTNVMYRTKLPYRMSIFMYSWQENMNNENEQLLQNPILGLWVSPVPYIQSATHDNRPERTHQAHWRCWAQITPRVRFFLCVHYLFLAVTIPTCSDEELIKRTRHHAFLI